MASASDFPPRIKPLSEEAFIAQPLGIPSDSTTPASALAIIECPHANEEVVMENSASRRVFLQTVTALGAASGGSVALGTDTSHAQDALKTAQAQPIAPIPSPTDRRGGLSRVQLMIGPGTLPSVGKDRMGVLRYRLRAHSR